MCGIVGFVDKNKRTDIIDNMLEVQSHRGPDDRGIFSIKKLVFTLDITVYQFKTLVHMDTSHS